MFMDYKNMQKLYQSGGKKSVPREQRESKDNYELTHQSMFKP